MLFKVTMNTNATKSFALKLQTIKSKLSLKSYCTPQSLITIIKNGARHSNNRSQLVI